MAERAQVTSVEAIEAFRANLIIYQTRARSALDEVSGDIQRAKSWLENDQRHVLEQEKRVRDRKLEEAKNELFSARLSSLQQSSSVQLLAVQRAERALQEADQKMTMLKKWDRELENHSEPLLKQVDQLHSFLTTEMPRAIAYLTQVVRTLEAYADVPSPGNTGGEGRP